MIKVYFTSDKKWIEPALSKKIKKGPTAASGKKPIFTPPTQPFTKKEKKKKGGGIEALMRSRDFVNGIFRSYVCIVQYIEIIHDDYLILCSL